MKRLTSLTLERSSLTTAQVERMWEIFHRYYLNTTKEIFTKDLNDKDIVFLLVDQKSQEIQGFSTLKNIAIKEGKKTIHAVFSGDTIIEKEYWGQGALGIAFLKYLFMQKLRRPFSPLYWFLISKGFKTYLLMANNFQTHYPRFESKTPKSIQSLIDHLGESLFADSYRSDLGLIKIQNKDALKEDVAPITVDMLKNERISYFVKLNPDWKKGDELVCLAQMTLFMPFYYQFKIIQKNLKKFSDSTLGKLSELFGIVVK